MSSGRAGEVAIESPNLRPLDVLPGIARRCSSGAHCCSSTASRRRARGADFEPCSSGASAASRVAKCGRNAGVVLRFDSRRGGAPRGHIQIASPRSSSSRARSAPLLPVTRAGRRCAGRRIQAPPSTRRRKPSTRPTSRQAVDVNIKPCARRCFAPLPRHKAGECGPEAVGSLLSACSTSRVLHHVGFTSSFTMAVRRELPRLCAARGASRIRVATGRAGPAAKALRRADAQRMPVADQPVIAAMICRGSRCGHACAGEVRPIQGDRFPHSTDLFRCRQKAVPMPCRYTLEVFALPSLRKSFAPDRLPQPSLARARVDVGPPPVPVPSSSSACALEESVPSIRRIAIITRGTRRKPSSSALSVRVEQGRARRTGRDRRPKAARVRTRQHERAVETSSSPCTRLPREVCHREGNVPDKPPRSLKKTPSPSDEVLDRVHASAA